MKKTLIFACSLLCLSSCAVHRKKLADLNKGMSKQDVVSILGQPDNLIAISSGVEVVEYDMRTSRYDPRCTQYSFGPIPLNSCELKLRYGIVIENNELVAVEEEDSHLARRARLAPIASSRRSLSYAPEGKSRQNPWSGASRSTVAPNVGAFLEGAWAANNK